MGRVRALPPAYFEPAPFPTALQEELQEPQLGMPLDQPSTELGEDGEVKPWVA
jgi:hypothetical protein